MTTISKGSISSKGGRENSPESVETTGIIDIRTPATGSGGGVVGFSRTQKKRLQPSYKDIVFDEKQMMSVKVARNTLEKPTTRKTALPANSHRET